MRIACRIYYFRQHNLTRIHILLRPILCFPRHSYRSRWVYWPHHVTNAMINCQSVANNSLHQHQTNFLSINLMIKSFDWIACEVLSEMNQNQATTDKDRINWLWYQQVNADRLDKIKNVIF